MSWSITAIGKPAKISEALDAHSASLSGQSKTEFDDAKPHIAALVTQNFNANPANGDVLVKVEASGSGSSVNGAQTQRSCTVKIEQLWGKLLI